MINLINKYDFERIDDEYIYRINSEKLISLNPEKNIKSFLDMTKFPWKNNKDITLEEITQMIEDRENPVVLPELLCEYCDSDCYKTEDGVYKCTSCGNVNVFSEEEEDF